MKEVIIPTLTSLVGQSPVLLVYLVGMILALVFWSRYPSPCLLVLIGSVLLLGLTVTQTFVIQYLFRARVELGWEHEKLAWVLSAVGLTGSFLRAIGLGLLLAAVFLGRRGAQRAGPGEPPETTGPAARPSEEHGITTRPSG